MGNFITIVQQCLEERNKTIKDLFADKIVSPNTFYKYKQRNPSLSTLIKIANYLEMTIDYMYELSEENNFVKYSADQSNFYNTLTNLINLSHISSRQFCKELNYAKDNVLRYKKGVAPSVRTLFEIASYFNCSVDDLLDKMK